MSALPLFRQTIYRAHIHPQMENAQNPSPTKVAIMDQKPEDEDDFIKREVVFHNGHWCIHAIEPVEFRTAQDMRQMIEFMRDERCW